MLPPSLPPPPDKHPTRSLTTSPAIKKCMMPPHNPNNETLGGISHKPTCINTKKHEGTSLQRKFLMLEAYPITNKVAYRGVSSAIGSTVQMTHKEWLMKDVFQCPIPHHARWTHATPHHQENIELHAGSHQGKQQKKKKQYMPRKLMRYMAMPVALPTMGLNI